MTAHALFMQVKPATEALKSCHAWSEKDRQEKFSHVVVIRNILSTDSTELFQGWDLRTSECHFASGLWKLLLLLLAFLRSRFFFSKGVQTWLAKWKLAVIYWLVYFTSSLKPQKPRTLPYPGVSCHPEDLAGQCKLRPVFLAIHTFYKLS